MKFDIIERFVSLLIRPKNPLRARQGHKIGNKYFYCIQGVIRVNYVKKYTIRNRLLKI